MRLTPFIAIAAALAAAAMTALPQGRAGSQGARSGDTSKVEHKNRAPVSKDLISVRLPRAKEATLSNGLTVLIIEDHRLPLVSLQYNIAAAGPIFEPRNLPGLASITASMMDEGTTSRKSAEIAEAVERLGASLNVTSSYGSTTFVVSAAGLADNFDAWFALANDVLLNPSFPKDELDRLKERLRVALRQQRTDPDFLATERFNRAVYGQHPAGTVTTTLTAINAITPEKLAAWRQERVAPQNTVLGIAGDVHAETLIPKLEKALGSWKQTDLRETLPPHPKPVEKRSVFVVNRPGAAQTNLSMGNIAIDRISPDYFPFVVAHQVLGGNGSARLFTKLREEKGYTYGAYSSFVARKYPGPWIAYGNSRTEVTGESMTEFVNELRRLREEPVTQKELDDAKKAIVASFALSLESKDELLSYAISQKVYNLPADYWDQYPAHVNAITAADIQRVAAKHMNPETMQIVAVGAAATVVPALQKYGPVEVYNIEGKRLR